MRHVKIKLMLSTCLATFTLCVFAQTHAPAPLVVTTTKKVSTPFVKPAASSPITQHNITSTKSASITNPSTSQTPTQSSNANPQANPKTSVTNGTLTTSLPTKGPTNIEVKNTGGNVGGVSGPTDGSAFITDQPTKN
jgi:hypothetical protein